jgi:hypothetical protein
MDDKNQNKRIAAPDASAARRRPQYAAHGGSAAARERVALALTDAASLQLKIVDEKPGFDPYNSGSFDRNRAWSRVPRR